MTDFPSFSFSSSVEEVRSLAMSCSDLEQTYDVEYDVGIASSLG